MGRWDLQIGQKRPLNKLILAHTGAVLALDWSPHSSSPATRQVELPEENVIPAALISLSIPESQLLD